MSDDDDLDDAGDELGQAMARGNWLYVVVTALLAIAMLGLFHVCVAPVW